MLETIRIVIPTEKILEIHNRLKVVRDCQRSYANVRRKHLESHTRNKAPLQDHFVEKPVDTINQETKNLEHEGFPIIKAR